VPLSHIEHYLVAADDMERTRDWYRDVLGMQEGWHPDFGFPVYWMYLDGKDVVHIGRSARQASDNQKAYLGRLAQDSGAGTGARAAASAAGCCAIGPAISGSARWAG